MEQLRYTIIFQPEPEGGFTVMTPAFPGCVTYGRDLAEAKEMAVDAIGGYLASLQKHREPILSESEPFISFVRVKKPAQKERALAHA